MALLAAKAAYSCVVHDKAGLIELLSSVINAGMHDIF